MADVTLEQVLASPLNEDALYQHMQKLGVVAPPPAEPARPVVPPIQPAAATPRIPEIQPAAHPAAAASASPAMSNVPEGVGATAPMAPEDHVLPHLGFKERQALPQVSPGAQVDSSAFDRNQLERMSDQNKNHWGTPENHPGFGGKLAHVFSKIGNVAGDIVAPGTMALIPGTELNRMGQGAELHHNLGAAETRETAAEAVRQRPEIAELTGEMRGRTEREREQSLERIAGLKDTGATKRTGMQVEGRENVADTAAGAKRDVADTQADVGREKIKSQKEINNDRIASAERIATGRNLANTEIAKIRAAAANDPNKLTNTMKTMKQQAQVTLPRIGSALDETEAVADLLGPTSGRWNDFWQGKVGESDPRFAHYKDEISYISTAVTLAHARGRMSNELFEHFQKMFDAGKQAPENMIQALTVAQEWLSDYANLGEAGTPTGPGAGAVPERPHTGPGTHPTPAATPPSAKTFTQKDVDDAAHAHNMSADDIEKAFLAKGYTKRQ